MGREKALGLSKKYLKFFVQNINSRHVVVQGGRRSGKSFSVYKWCWFLASGLPKTVLVVTASFPSLQLAINDFQRATGLTVTGNAIYGYSCRLTNGSMFQFRSFDDFTKAQGTTANIVILEEALNIDENIVSTLLMSVTDQVYFCFNPTRQSYIDKYILPDKHNYLKTTFKDNPHLTEAQIGEFEMMKERALSPKASVLDRYQYTVYYLGNFGSMSGKVFKDVTNIPDDEYSKIPAPELFALDFGFTENEQSDATALIGCKIYDHNIYYKEYIYSTELSNNEELALRMADIGLDVYSNIVADYGGMGSTRIRALVTAGDYTWTDPRISSGFSVQNAAKGKVIDGLNRMLQFTIHVTDSSVNLRYEFDNYELNASGKVKNGCADHALDACRYATTSYHLYFEI